MLRSSLDVVVTHNHPDGSSFSKSDIRQAASLNVSEIRVTTAEHVYSMRPGSSGWNLDYFRTIIVPSFDRHDDELVVEYETALHEGRVTRGEMEIDFQDEVWRRVSAELGLKYTKSRW